MHIGVGVCACLAHVSCRITRIMSHHTHRVVSHASCHITRIGSYHMWCMVHSHVWHTSETHHISWHVMSRTCAICPHLQCNGPPHMYHMPAHALPIHACVGIHPRHITCVICPYMPYPYMLYPYMQCEYSAHVWARIHVISHVSHAHTCHMSAARMYHMCTCVGIHPGHITCIVCPCIMYAPCHITCITSCHTYHITSHVSCHRRQRLRIISHHTYCMSITCHVRSHTRVPSCMSIHAM